MFNQSFVINNVNFSAVVGDGPVITGGKPKYQKGDIVDVNCTAAKSNPAAELKWYINDKLVRHLYYFYSVFFVKKFFVVLKCNIWFKNFVLLVLHSYTLYIKNKY